MPTSVSLGLVPVAKTTPSANATVATNLSVVLSTTQSCLPVFGSNAATDLLPGQDHLRLAVYLDEQRRAERPRAVRAVGLPPRLAGLLVQRREEGLAVRVAIDDERDLRTAPACRKTRVGKRTHRMTSSQICLPAKSWHATAILSPSRNVTQTWVPSAAGVELAGVLFLCIFSAVAVSTVFRQSSLPSVRSKQSSTRSFVSGTNDVRNTRPPETTGDECPMPWHGDLPDDILGRAPRHRHGGVVRRRRRPSARATPASRRRVSEGDVKRT